MSNIQIKGVDENLYQELKQIAENENRSISQQVLFLIKNYLAQKRIPQQSDTAAQTLLSLAGSWEDSRSAEEIIGELKSLRYSSNKLSKGF